MANRFGRHHETPDETLTRWTRTLAAAAAVLAAAAAAPSAWAHARIVSTTPGDGAVLASAPLRVTIRFDDIVRVLGRAQPVRIYELIAKVGALRTLEHEKALRSYAAGLEVYRQKIWSEALILFEQAFTVWPPEDPARPEEVCQAIGPWHPRR